MGVTCSVLWVCASLLLGVVHAATASPELKIKALASAPQPAPDWVVEAYRGLGPRLIPAFDEMLPGRLPASSAISVRVGWNATAPGMLSIDAETTAEGITIVLRGAAWAEKTPSAQFTLTQNLAHELAHVWQRATYLSLLEPRWLHEGMAEALGVEALRWAKLWTRARARAHVASAEAACAEAMAAGPISIGLQAGDRRAVYGCGYVLVDLISTNSGLPPAPLLVSYAEGLRGGEALGGLASRHVDDVYLGQLSRLLHGDHTARNGQEVIDAARAGRL